MNEQVIIHLTWPFHSSTQAAPTLHLTWPFHISTQAAPTLHLTWPFHISTQVAPTLHLTWPFHISTQAAPTLHLTWPFHISTQATPTLHLTWPFHISTQVAPTSDRFPLLNLNRWGSVDRWWRKLLWPSNLRLKDFILSHTKKVCSVLTKDLPVHVVAGIGVKGDNSESWERAHCVITSSASQHK